MGGHIGVEQARGVTEGAEVLGGVGAFLKIREKKKEKKNAISVCSAVLSTTVKSGTVR